MSEYKIQVRHPSGKGGFQTIYDCTEETVDIYWPLQGYGKHDHRLLKDGEVIIQSGVSRKNNE